MRGLRERFKSGGMCAIGLLAMVAMLVLFALFLRGVVWVSDELLPWLTYASSTALILCVVIFLPLSFFRKTRPFAAMCYYIASFVFGSTVWAYSCVIAYDIWGLGALIIGLVLAGVGVVPVACLATLFHGDWGTLGMLLLGVLLTFGARGSAIYLMSKVEHRTNDGYETKRLYLE
jgi:hypothetical protein